MVWPEEPPKASYILKNVSCDSRPGEIIAIAGPSGAGKTNLLEILAGMIPLNNIVGQVLVNKQPMNAQYFRRISGYVTQDEALFLLLTVKETLMYSTRLRLRSGLEKATSRVEKLLDEFGLEHIAN
ncbi:ABC transporter G family member 10-like, partial [Prunus avium]|uniref:ABC transporter G family member 10-like n=1 Tax=Prunus avium TaxID=42229 RepID=A0A6P5RQI2_PRUAV